MSDFTVPAEWRHLADRLDQVASTVRDHLELDEKPWPESISAREQACERDFAALPLEHPVVHTLLMPRQFLGSSQDHLVAMAAAIRTPMTVMATLTLLRTQVVGAAYPVYLADPGIGQRERVRRAMNVYLDSTTEQMRLIGHDDTDEYDRLAERRRQIAVGARALGWTVNRPEAGRSGWPKDWWIGTRPPTEMALVESMLGDVASEDRVGHTLYRYLCSVSHVQPHGLLSFIDRERSVSRSDGSALAAVGMDGRLLMTLALLATGSLTIAMDKCVGLYGWPPEAWRETVVPFFNDLRSALGVPESAHGVHLLGD
jgi:hypothetical protein